MVRPFFCTAVVCLAAACGGPRSGRAEDAAGPDDQARRSVVTVAYADPRTPGSARGERGIDIIVDLISGQGLVALSRDGRAVARLAERWDVSADGCVWRFTLRPNLTFQDGEPVTADAVRRVLEPVAGASEGAIAPGLRDLVAVEGPSPREVVVRLRRPNAFLIDALAQSGVESQKKAVAGPYRIVSRAGSRASLGRFDGYYGGAPKIDSIALAEYGSQREAWSAMLRNEVDVLYEVSPEAFEFVKESPSTHVATFLRAYVSMLAFNVKNPTLGRREVRKALNLAIDRREVIETARGGRGVPAADPIWPHHWARDTSAPAYDVDRAAAAVILDAAHLRRRGGAGTSTRFAFSCLIPNDLRFERLALVLQRQLLSIDVDMRLEAVPFDEYAQRLATGRFDAYLGERLSGPGLGIVYWFWHSNPSNPYFRTGYASADAVLDQLRAARTDEETRAGVRALQQKIYDDPPAAFLYWDQASRVVSRRFTLPAGTEDQDIMRSLDRWELAGTSPP